MTNQCSLSCSCGKMEWHIAEGAEGKHMMCYCADCQTFPRHLGKADTYLTNGGTQLFQTVPGNFQFDKGLEHLGLKRLGPNGLFRWYAKCCDTPIANTVPKARFPFVGAVLPAGHDHFGRVTAHVNTGSAPLRTKQTGMTATVYGIFFRAAKAAITGKGKTSPFFDETGAPIVTPTVLTQEQRQAAQP